MSRFGYVMTACVAALAFSAAAAFPPAPKLVWNASNSVPIGLYAIRPVGALHVSELVIVRPPDPLAVFLNQRRYLAKGVPMLKRVLALPGQTVCRAKRSITVNGMRWARRPITTVAASPCPRGAAVASSQATRCSS